MTALADTAKITHTELRDTLRQRASARPGWLTARHPAGALTAERLLARACSLPFQGGLPARFDHLDVLLTSALLQDSQGSSWIGSLAVDRIGAGTLTTPAPVYVTVTQEIRLTGSAGTRELGRSTPGDAHEDLPELLARINARLQRKLAAGYTPMGSNPTELTFAQITAAVERRETPPQ